MLDESKETHLLPNGAEVEYYPDGHIYKVGGKELPSVTTLIKNVYGGLYDAVAPLILQRAAEHGTAVHEELSRLIDMRKADPGIDIASEFKEVRDYFEFVEPIYKIEPVMTEKIVVLYGPDGEPAAAGRFDLFCEVAGAPTLADFKTTSQIHRQAVTAQLNLYLKAAVQSGYDIPADSKLGVIHLGSGKARFVPIAKMPDDFYLRFVI